MKPSIGRIVHYVLANGEHRAAIVVNAFGLTVANLTVLLDQMNDVRVQDEANGVRRRLVKGDLSPMGAIDPENGTLAVGSAAQDEDTKAPGTWHWPERE